MKGFLFFCLLGVSVVFHSAYAAALDRAQYQAAERAFYSYDEKQRFEIPLLLIAAGHFNAMSTGTFGPRVFNSIQSYQSSIGSAPTGSLTSDQFARLRMTGYGAMSAWGMAEVRNPFTDAKLFVPKKAAPLQQATAHGYTFDAYDRSISVDYSFFSSSERTLEDVYARLIAPGGGRRIDYKVIRSTFLAVAGGVGARAFYSKYQIARNGGVVGFTVNWDPDRIERGDRIPNLMANLFFAPLYGGADTAAQAAYTPPTEPISPAPVPQPSAPPPAAEAQKPEPKEGGGSGTGFFITRTRLLTNAHVVKGCTSVVLRVGQEQASGRVLAKDERNDLALVESSKPNDAIAKLRAGVRLGEDVAAFGFPLNGLLATSGNFTRGGVTATAGLLDDSSQIQISAPVQPGNSGGPLLDESGNVVGVVVAKLKALQVAAITGDIAQNVNFAIKASVAQTFLEANSTTFDAGAAGETMKPADLAGLAQSVSAVIECKP